MQRKELVSEKIFSMPKTKYIGTVLTVQVTVFEEQRFLAVFTKNQLSF